MRESSLPGGLSNTRYEATASQSRPAGRQIRIPAESLRFLKDNASVTIAPREPKRKTTL